MHERRKLRTKMQYKEIMYQQLARDMRCTVAEIKNSQHLYLHVDISKEAVTRVWNNTRLCIICLSHKMIVRSDNKALLDEIASSFDAAEYMWFSEIDELLKLQKILMKYGITLTETSPYLIPAKDFLLTPVTIDYKTATLFGEELAVFRGNKQFSEALAFQEEHPDMVAVVVKDNDTVIGMAGASRDSLDMWQIGIDVLPAYRGKNLAAMLVHNLALTVIENYGKLPFYSTAFSHISSLNVAGKAGFEFGWYELNGEFMENDDE